MTLEANNLYQIPMIMTLTELESIPSGAVFAEGTTTNDPEGVYMTDHRRGDKLKWVAKKGGILDWAIYCDWAEATREHCISNGQKVTSRDNIRKLVPCTDEMMKVYRY